MSAPKQRTPEWHEARRLGITSTDIVAILGLSRWSSEGDVAREKLTGETKDETPESVRRMRIGRAMERIIADEEVAEHGGALRHVDRLITHPTIPWALTSLDFQRVGERVIVETKNSARRLDDGLPEDWEAQVRWQMGVAGFPKAHVAALRFGNQLACFDVEHDQAVFDGMVAIAEDFRARLAAGGPFEESRSSISRAFPLDDGTAIVADPDLTEAVLALQSTRYQIKALEEQEGALKLAIQTRMGPATLLQGRTFRVTWRRTKDSTQVRWNALAEQLLADYPEKVQEAMKERHSETMPGYRRFVVTQQTEEAR